MGLINVIAGGPKGGGGFPVLSFTPGAGLTPSTPSGSAAGQAAASGLPGAAWSIATTAPLAIDAASGAVTTTGALSSGTMNATITATATIRGQTIQVSFSVALDVSSPGTLDFGQAGNPLETVI